MNPSLTSQLADDRQASLLAEASRQHRPRQARTARRASRRSISLRAVRPLRLATWRRGRVPA
jgi:hypothetical protein